MDPFDQLVVAAAAFLATHFVSSTPLRAALAGAFGERAYLGLYSLAAFATLGWMIYAYRLAPLEPLWAGWRHLPAAVMPFALILIVCGVMSRNPTAVGQARLLAGEHPARGVLRVTRHPVMWGILLWSGAHILARAELKALVFFGTFFVLAGLGTRLIDARRARERGDDWQRYAAATSNIPFVAIAQGRNGFHLAEIGFAKIGIGLVVYAVVMAAHPWLFGVRPW